MKPMKITRMLKSLGFGVGLALALIFALAAYAQIPGGEREPDSPQAPARSPNGLADPPMAGFTPVYIFTGAADNTNAATKSMATVVHCTNYGITSTIVLLELSDFDNIPTITGTVNISPNETRTFASQHVPYYGLDKTFNVVDDINQGAGRISVNKHSDILCEAQVVDPTNNPPSFAIELPLYDRNGVLLEDTLPRADLSVQKSANVTMTLPGDPITYTLLYTNTGNGIASGVLITDVVPSVVSNPTFSSSGAALTPQPGPKFAWQVENLLPDTGGAITITGSPRRQALIAEEKRACCCRQNSGWTRRNGIP